MATDPPALIPGTKEHGEAYLALFKDRSSTHGSLSGTSYTVPRVTVEKLLEEGVPVCKSFAEAPVQDYLARAGIHASSIKALHQHVRVCPMHELLPPNIEADVLKGLEDIQEEDIKHSMRYVKKNDSMVTVFPVPDGRVKKLLRQLDLGVRVKLQPEHIFNSFARGCGHSDPEKAQWSIQWREDEESEDKVEPLGAQDGHLDAYAWARTHENISAEQVDPELAQARNILRVNRKKEASKSYMRCMLMKATKDIVAQVLVEVPHLHFISMSILSQIGGPFFLWDGTPVWLFHAPMTTDASTLSFILDVRKGHFPGALEAGLEKVL